VGGRRDPWQGRVLGFSRGYSVGQSCSQLQISTGKHPMGTCKRKVQRASTIKIKSFPESVFSVSCSQDRPSKQECAGRGKEIEKEL